MAKKVKLEKADDILSAMSLLDEVKKEDKIAVRDVVKTIVRRVQKDVRERQLWIKNRMKQIDLYLKIQDRLLDDFENNELNDNAITEYKAEVDRIANLTASTMKKTQRPMGQRFSDDEEQF